MLGPQLLPAQHYSFTIDIQIDISRANLSGHLDNAYLLPLVSEARFDCLGNWATAK
jgi:hypothetical protein